MSHTCSNTTPTMAAITSKTNALLKRRPNQPCPGGSPQYGHVVTDASMSSAHALQALIRRSPSRRRTPLPGYGAPTIRARSYGRKMGVDAVALPPPMMPPSERDSMSPDRKCGGRNPFVAAQICERCDERIRPVGTGSPAALTHHAPGAEVARWISELRLTRLSMGECMGRCDQLSTMRSLRRVERVRKAHLHHSCTTRDRHSEVLTGT